MRPQRKTDRGDAECAENRGEEIGASGASTPGNSSLRRLSTVFLPSAHLRFLRVSAVGSDGAQEAH
jgi:hypothetical protein